MTSLSTVRVFIVTGGTGALGQSVVSRLLSTGSHVIVTYRSKDELNALADRLSGDERQRFTPFHVDVTSYPAVNEFVDHVVNEYGRIDGLANLVGGYAEKPFVESTPEEWQKMLNLNLISTIFVTRAVLPVMIRSGYGRIVSVGSRGAIQALPNAAAYNVSKVGVMWLMETISNEVRNRNITA
ncbi:MAG: SDR family NAD(P)-dependent oxidoreductase, partial [Candidatus Kerfeldbacteria bacterium]|nr:SDR family NAD(P)-dependent oxidoreductase [Candidatus Kerfeldbacteria bacterium]